MDKQFTDSARKVMVLAEQEARGLGHQYVGTEHVLLGILGEGSGVTMGALATCGVDAGKVRTEIEKLVQRGPDSAGISKIPRTRRANKAIEYARDEARILSHQWIGPEHLLMGLIREDQGVAGLVLRSLGLNAKKVGQEVFKIRLSQFKMVERVVRPVRVTTVAKRKMREELLAHLEAIYEQEQARLGDSAAAMKEAASRLGDPVELSRELQSSVTFAQWCGYHAERRFGWRPPEHAVRWMARLAVQLFGMLATGMALLMGVAVWRLGWDRTILIALRPLEIALLLVPADVFLLGLLYFTLRDALWGPPWARRSRAKVVWLGVLIAMVVMGTGFVFGGVAYWDAGRGIDLMYRCGIAGIVVAIWTLVYAHSVGPIEIRDTVWACLDVQD
jgi:Clp amino terminal domain, pathogenicity island component